MSEKAYHLVRFDTINVDEDFNTFVSHLSSITEITVAPENDQVIIVYKNKNQQAFLKKISLESKMALHASMMIQCQASDYDTLKIFRAIAPSVKYRLYDHHLGCFLPRDANLNHVSQLVISEKITSIFRIKGYSPLFSYLNTDLFYAQPADRQDIHFINPALLDYFAEYGLEETPTPEFSYRVAPSLIDFVALHDQGLIPASYYQYYQKPLKIINHSGFDLSRINRKVFVKPWFFLYDKTKQEYSLMTAEKSALHLADKIRPGETLDMTIKRILREEVKMADDYLRAKVTKIEFDRDRYGKLTPRLWVSIYLKEIKNIKAVKEKAQRGWVSRDKEIN